MILALVVMACAVVLLCVLGLLLVPDTLSRIHLLGPLSIIAPLLLAVAISLREGFTQSTDKACAIAFGLAVASPILAHVTARAHWLRQTESEKSR